MKSLFEIDIRMFSFSFHLNQLSRDIKSVLIIIDEIRRSHSKLINLSVNFDNSFDVQTYISPMGVFTCSINVRKRFCVLTSSYATFRRFLQFKIRELISKVQLLSILVYNRDTTSLCIH